MRQALHRQRSGNPQPRMMRAEKQMFGAEIGFDLRRYHEVADLIAQPLLFHDQLIAPIQRGGAAEVERAILVKRLIGGHAFLDHAIEEAIAQFSRIRAALQPRPVRVQRMCGPGERPQEARRHQRHGHAAHRGDAGRQLDPAGGRNDVRSPVIPPTNLSYRARMTSIWQLPMNTMCLGMFMDTAMLASA